MSDAFVWFYNDNEKPNESRSFCETLLGWKASAGPAGMTLLARDALVKAAELARNESERARVRARLEALSASGSAK